MTGERVLAFAGTSPWSIADLMTDDTVLNGQVPTQFEEALQTYNEVAGQYGSEGLYVTGHSLGGALASYVSAIAADHPDATVFNSLGVGEIVPPGTYNNINNYNTLLDPATLFWAFTDW